MAYAKFRSDTMSGTTNPEDLVSVIYQVSNADTAIENGKIVKVGALVDGEREVRVATAPAKGDSLDDLAIIGGDEIVRDKAKYTKGDFINKAGVPARAYRAGKKHQIFSVSANALSGTVAKGSLVELDGTVTLAVVASATSGSTTVGKIIAIEGDWVVIEIGA